jgi:hypothetical protein
LWFGDSMRKCLDFDTSHHTQPDILVAGGDGHCAGQSDIERPDCLILAIGTAKWPSIEAEVAGSSPSFPPQIPKDLWSILTQSDNPRLGWRPLRHSIFRNGAM